MAKQAKRNLTLAVGKGETVSRRIRMGQLVADTDPAVKAHPHLFDDVDALIEQATANPGEKRSVTKKKTKAE